MSDYAIGERILYRLIKKHIAGTTMSSAIDKAKELNGKKLPVSIEFLSDSSGDRIKARYATTTYLELIRRIARMGLKASIQVPLSQIGYGISEDVAERNMEEILGTANRYGVFVWFETQGWNDVPRPLKDARGVGYAVDLEESEAYVKSNGPNIRALKILCSGEAKAKKDSKKVSKSLRTATKMVKNAVLQSVPEGAIKEFLKTSTSKKSLTFEFQLGYRGKELKGMVKRGMKASVYFLSAKIGSATR